MPYADQAALEDAFGQVEIRQLADRDRSGAADPAFVAAVLARADSLIDSYLAGRYALPISPTPPVLTATACDLARYWLYDDAAPERVREGYEDAVAWLKDVASGKVVLQLTAATGDTAVAGSPDWDAPERLFTAATLATF